MGKKWSRLRVGDRSRLELVEDEGGIEKIRIQHRGLTYFLFSGR